MDSAAPLFFCFGLPKSGTTFLQRLLNLHPDISCPSEHQLESLRRNFELLFSEYNKALANVDSRTGGQGPTPVSADAVNEIFRHAVETMARDAAGGKRIAGLNDNGAARNLDFYDALFARPVMIAIFRNPFDMAVSA